MSSNDQNKSLVIQEFGLVTFYHILPENWSGLFFDAYWESLVIAEVGSFIHYPGFRNWKCKNWVSSLGFNFCCRNEKRKENDWLLTKLYSNQTN